MSSWWQKKLLRYGLRYGLSQTGLLEDTAIDLDNLEITLGKQNVIELKDVGLNIKRIAKLAQLPPCIRLETARVLFLRLTIPADVFQSSIVVEIDGVELLLRLDDTAERTPPQELSKPRHRSQATARTPQHRKMNRRLHSPPPYDAGGLADPEEEIHIPTAEEVAHSFLTDEPSDERRELEATLGGIGKGVEESIRSESSEGGDTGTGTGVGVPGFLAGFIRGLVDRFRLEVKNVQVRVETAVPDELNESLPVTLRLKVGGVKVDRMDTLENELLPNVERQRVVQLSDISVDLLSATVASKDYLRSTSSRCTANSDSQSRSIPHQHKAIETSRSPTMLHSQAPSTDHATTSLVIRRGEEPLEARSQTLQASRQRDPQASMASVESESFADARGQRQGAEDENPSDSDIQPGDDNISWGSRRRNASTPPNDLWKSMTSDDDLPDSLILDTHSRANWQLSQTHGLPNLRQGSHNSAHDHSIRGPGSWPRLDESPQRHRLQQGPGSWPALNQIQQSATEPLAQVLTAAEGGTPDKAETYDTETQMPIGSDDGEEGSNELLESRVFSHEEAQSIYMSAMMDSPKMAIPGGWGVDTQSEISEHSVDEQGPISKPADEEARLNVAGSALCVDGSTSGYATPRAQTATPFANTPPATVPAHAIERRQLICIDTLSISIPGAQATSDDEAEAEPLQSQQRANSAYGTRGMPGTFSVYSELTSSRMRGPPPTQAQSSSAYSPEPAQSTTAQRTVVHATLGTVRAHVDFPTGRVLYTLANKILSCMNEPGASKSEAKRAQSPTDQPSPTISVHVERLVCSLRDTVQGRSLAIPTENNGLIDAIAEHVRLKISTDVTLRVGDLAVRMGGKDLLTFDHDNSDSTASQILPKDSPAIGMDVTRNRFCVDKRPVTDVALHTASVNLSVDLTAIDETFDSFGGLSGVLELGSSMLSEGTASSPTSAKAPKGVRFAGDSESKEDLEPEVKLNGRINAITVALRGVPCSLVLQTSTMKLIHREVGMIATVERVSLKGPIVRDQTQPVPIVAEMATVRVEFHQQPQDKDLERLLSLLTPSKDKYDSDDDILIDTLLRQRRKGSLLRAAIGDVKLRVDDWECLSTLLALSDEFVKLSAVTKYLPEDDRPGLLTLLRIKSGEVRCPVNARFGMLRCTLQDLHLAHVGLPALLAFAVGGVAADQLDGANLVHALVPSAGADGLPMIMARMLGDEEEPTVKIKLFNFGLEYSVPVLLDLTDLAENMDTHEIVNVIAQSVADLATDIKSPKLERLSSDLSVPPTKRTNIKLLVHDSAIGLTPQRLSSKALFVLTDAYISTLVPPEQTLSVKLELRKASLFLTDRILGESSDAAPQISNPVNYADTTQRLASTLSKQGFVSMGSIMSAKVAVRVKSGVLNSEDVVEVDVNNELFLLETCADSTQTLIATLSALAPPTPPDKQPRYNVEPMTIEDMMASFTGDPFAKPELPTETLFDAEADQEDELNMLMGASGLSVADDLLAGSDMTASLYLPMGGDMDEHDEDESTIGEDYPATVESLLEEEDPFEMPSSPLDANLGDAALMRDLARQCKPALCDEPVDLGLYEIEDLGYDALGSGQQALGTHHRFNAPYAGRPNAKQQQVELPFKLKLRDFHVIWHIYDGYDWQRTRDGIIEAVEQVELKAEERRARRRQSINDREDDESVIGDFLFNSIYIGVPADHDAQELRRRINRNIDEQISETESIPVSGMSRPTVYSASGQPRRQRQRRRLKLGRSRNHKIAFELKGVSADVLVFPPNSGEVVSAVDLRVKDFEIFDKVPTSTWRKFLTHMDNDFSTREMAKPMFHIQLDNVKTLESHSASEIVLKVTVLPLRLHVDQDALDFITRFFEFKDESTVSAEPAGEQPFLQRVEIDTVDMCLDYKPKNVDYVGLRSGRTTEFVNFITLDASMIRLKHAIVYGLRGFDTLHQTLNDVWMPDIQRNQLPGILAGLAPVRSLVNLGSGMRDVVAIPVREYKKDGRIVRSIQKGAFHFGKTTASELARLGAKVALGTQTILTNAEQFLSPEISSPTSTRPGTARNSSWHDIASDDDEPEQRAISAYANQPLGVFAGLRSARRYLEHDLLTAKDALIAVRGEFLESRGPGGVATAVARHAPTVLLRPVIGATRAVGTTLLGVGNQIDRDNLRRMDDKYKPR